MLDHVSIGVRDLAAARRFYDAVLEPLGYRCLSSGKAALGYGRDAGAFWVHAVERPVPADPESGLHICFTAPSRGSVDAFHAAALAAGGRDNGKPGLRPEYSPDYYAGFVIDPEGYRIEAYHGRRTREAAFTDALQAASPAADRAGRMDLYGWLIGSWDLEVTEHLPDGSERRRPGEWHFAWVLEGRAIQDVWIVPPRGARRGSDAAAQAEYYGTTLRIYDPRIDAWHIRYFDPVIQAEVTQTGRRQGEGIIQEGTDSTGTPRRWSFSEITPESFRWRGEVSTDGGKSWQVQTEFLARRRSGA